MTALHGKRILVTGATGFVGANLTRALLRDGARVHAVVRATSSLWRLDEIRAGLTLHTADLCRFEDVEKVIAEVRPEIIFHLAAQGVVHSQRNQWETVRANILSTANLLEGTAALPYDRFVHVGGSTEYGVRARPLREVDRLDPTTLYGASKAAASILCQQVAREGKHPLVVLRPFSVYGCWEPSTRLIPAAILAVLQGRAFDLTSPGIRRDFVFVEDVVEACLLAAQSGKAVGQTINVGTGTQWSNEEVLDIVQAAAGRRIELKVGAFPSRVSDTSNWVADARRARRILGWEARHTLIQGIEKSVAWFRDHQALYATAPSGRPT